VGRLSIFSLEGRWWVWWEGAWGLRALGLDGDKVRGDLGSA
jgi:hypothetical protein